MARKTKAQRKERRKRIVAGVKKAVRKVANAVGEATLTAPLLPFVPMMNSAIRKAGASPERKVSEKAKQFKRLVLAKNKNFESEQENIVEDITSIVSAIVSFFKSKRDKIAEKEAKGEPLTEGEENTKQAVDTIESEIEKGATNAAEEKIGEKVIGFVKKPVNILLLAGVVYFGAKALKKAS